MSESSKAKRGEKRRQEEQKDRRVMALYTVVAVVVAVAAVALLVWNTGLLQRNLTALDLNGAKYSAADMQYYYNSIYSSYANRYAFDSSTSVKKQVYDETTGQSWHDFLLDEAVQALSDSTALAAQAKAEGYTLSADSQASLDSYLTQLDTVWVGYGYSNRASFIKATYGSNMTYDRLVELINQEYLASDYAQSKLEEIEHPDADYEAYYDEHADELDTFVYSQLTLRAQVPTTDADGNTLELTDAEKTAQLETLKEEQKALAEEIKAKLEGGADPEDIAEEYEADLTGSAFSRRSVGSNIASATFGSWLLDSARKAGDVTLTEQELGSSVYYYYVTVFQQRLRDPEATHSVRHILLQAGNGSGTPTQEEYDEAEEKAQALLDGWKAGDATEDSFADLAAANSNDSGSASDGGLISGITSNSSYVEPFRNWAIDSARKPGDTELVKSEYGWHIMYYVSTDDPAWRITVTSALRDQDYEALTGEASSGWTVSQGMGMNLVGR